MEWTERSTFKQKFIRITFNREPPIETTGQTDYVNGAKEWQIIAATEKGSPLLLCRQLIWHWIKCVSEYVRVHVCIVVQSITGLSLAALQRHRLKSGQNIGPLIPYQWKRGKLLLLHLRVKSKCTLISSHKQHQHTHTHNGGKNNKHITDIHIVWLYGQIRFNIGLESDLTSFNRHCSTNLVQSMHALSNPSSANGLCVCVRAPVLEHVPDSFAWVVCAGKTPTREEGGLCWTGIHGIFCIGYFVLSNEMPYLITIFEWNSVEINNNQTSPPYICVCWSSSPRLVCYSINWLDIDKIYKCVNITFDG